MTSVRHIFFLLLPFYSTMEEQEDLIIRRKQINEFGEWEHECVDCELWLPKRRFSGCVEKIDAYGNCLVCSSCRQKNSNKKRKITIENYNNDFLTKLGFDVNSVKPVWQQFYDKHGFPY